MTIQRMKLLQGDKGQYLAPNNMSYAEIVEHYVADQCWGLLTSVDAQACSGDLIRSAEMIKNYVHELCDLIQMKRFQETTIVHFGEDERVTGYSMVQLIETSLISGHFANATNNAYIDIFSCKLYDPHLVAQFTKDFFGASDVSTNICFRR